MDYEIEFKLTLQGKDGVHEELDLPVGKVKELGLLDAAVILRKGRHYTYSKSDGPFGAFFSEGICLSLDRSDI